MRRRLGRIWALIKKETVQIVRDWRTLTMILLLPLIELFLFAYAVDLTVQDIPTAVADMSLDARSRELVDSLVVSGYFDVVIHVENEEQVLRAIDEGEARAGLVIPPDFAAQVEQEKAQALIIIDGSDSFTVKSGYSAAMSIAQARSMDMLIQKVERMGAGGMTSLPLTTSARVLYNPNLNDMIFIVPGIAAMLLQTMSISQAAIAVVREREMGTLEQLLVTPIRPFELIVGKMAPNLLLTMLDMLILVAAGVFWFGVPFRGSLPLFIWLSTLFIISGLGLGLLVSTVARNQKQAEQMSLFLMMLSMLLTGLIYPRAPMPPVVRAVGDLIPATYFTRIARGIITKGVGFSFMRSDVLVLVVYTVVVVALSTLTFNKRLD
ncbi:MAG: ABC transporter permease [Anaerolineae bacterium]